MWNVYTIALCGVLVGLAIFAFGFYVGFIWRDALERAIYRQLKGNGVKRE